MVTEPKSKFAKWCTARGFHLLLVVAVVAALVWKCFFVWLALYGRASEWPSEILIAENFVDDRVKSVHKWNSIYLSPNRVSFDLYAYVSENETSFKNESELVWVLKNLTYSQLRSIQYDIKTAISISEYVQTKGDLYLHLYMVRSGLLPSSSPNDQLNGDFCCFTCNSSNKTVHRSRRLNVYKRLTGGQFSDKLYSHWHPNLTINLVYYQTELGNVGLADFYFNDQYNLLGDYQPINETTKFLPLHLTFGALNLNRYWRYQEATEDPVKHFGNVRLMKYAAGLFGWFDRRLIQSEEDQDVVKRKLIESDFDLNGFGILSYYTGTGAIRAKTFAFFFIFMWALILQTFFEVLATFLFVPRPPNHMKTVSMRSTWFELIQSLATLEIPGQLVSKLSWILNTQKRKSAAFKYDPEANRLDALATRLFAAFVFLPSLVGYLVYAYHYDSYESFSCHIPMILYDFFWHFGTIIWIPQLYLNYKFKSYHSIFLSSAVCKIFYLITQIVCIPYFLNTGLFSLVLKNYPFLIVSFLTKTLVHAVMIYQLSYYQKKMA